MKIKNKVPGHAPAPRCCPSRFLLSGATLQTTPATEWMRREGKHKHMKEPKLKKPKVKSSRRRATKHLITPFPFPFPLPSQPAQPALLPIHPPKLSKAIKPYQSHPNPYSPHTSQPILSYPILVHRIVSYRIPSYPSHPSTRQKDKRPFPPSRTPRCASRFQRFPLFGPP